MTSKPTAKPRGQSMKLLRYGLPGAEKPGMLDDRGRIRELDAEIGDISPATISAHALDRLSRLDRDGLPVVSGTPRIGVPLAGIGKLVAVGLNYADHAKETGMPIPEELVLFMKAISSVSGPYDPVVIPRGFGQDRLGGRARLRRRQDRAPGRQGRRHRPHRRLLHIERCLRA